MSNCPFCASESITQWSRQTIKHPDGQQYEAQAQCTTCGAKGSYVKLFKPRDTSIKEFTDQIIALSFETVHEHINRELQKLIVDVIGDLPQEHARVRQEILAGLEALSRKTKDKLTKSTVSL